MLDRYKGEEDMLRKSSVVTVDTLSDNSEDVGATLKQHIA